MTKPTRFYGQTVKQMGHVSFTDRDRYFFDAGALGCASLRDAIDIMRAARELHRTVIDRSNGEATETQEQRGKRARKRLAELVTSVRYSTEDPRTFMVAVTFKGAGEVVVPVGGIVR